MFDQYDSRIRYNTYNLEENDEIKQKENLTNNYGLELGKSKNKINYENEFIIKKYKKKYKED